MVAYRILFLAGAVAALPLNINLGAYSPALVVGDGEISFGGNSDVSGLMNTLEGAAVTAANGATNNGAAQAQGQTGAAAAGAAQTQGAGQTAQTASTSTDKSVEQAQSEPSAVAATTTETTADASLSDQAQQIAALQGMGKAVVVRDVAADAAEEDDEEDEEEATSTIAKRDINSFDRALKFAEAALQKGPKVQLGTGKEGSGVGIIVDNNQQAAARPGTGATAAAGKRKRDVAGSGPKVKVTTMYVRSGIPTSLMNGNQMTARDLENAVREPHVETIQIAPNKREANPSPNAIDAVNLNVNGENGVTMTFVETVEDADDTSS